MVHAVLLTISFSLVCEMKLVMKIQRTSTRGHTCIYMLYINPVVYILSEKGVSMKREYTESG